MAAGDQQLRADHLRPIVSENHGYDRCVVWFRGTYTTYTNYDTQVVGLFQNQLKASAFNVNSDNTIDLTWDSGPGKTYRIMASGDLLNFDIPAVENIDSQGPATSHSFNLPNELLNAQKGFFRIEEQPQ